MGRIINENTIDMALEEALESNDILENLITCSSYKLKSDESGMGMLLEENENWLEISASERFSDFLTTNEISSALTKLKSEINRHTTDLLRLERRNDGKNPTIELNDKLEEGCLDANERNLVYFSSKSAGLKKDNFVLEYLIKDVGNKKELILKIYYRILKCHHEEVLNEGTGSQTTEQLIKEHILWARDKGACDQCTRPWHDGICSCKYGNDKRMQNIILIANKLIRSGNDLRHL